MPEYPAWVQEALDSGTVRAEELSPNEWYFDAERDSPCLSTIVHDIRIEIREDSWGFGNQGRRAWHDNLTPEQAIRQALALKYALSAQPTAEVERLQKRVGELEAALSDMLSGWKYIRATHGDLYGVGWNRCQEDAEQALSTETTGYVGDGEPIQKTDAPVQGGSE